MKRFFEALRLYIWLTGLLGVAYPFLLAFFASMTWNESAKGSLLVVKDQVRGSVFIGQAFTSDKYFWPRPSSSNYATLPSQGPTSFTNSYEHAQQIEQRSLLVQATHAGAPPAGLLYSSASGIDPDIMLPTALYQVDRVAKARGLSREQVIELVMHAKVKKPLNLFGRECVNVLLLNQSLDDLQPTPKEGQNE